MQLIVREARPDDAQAIIDILNPIVETGKYTVIDKTFTADEERAFIENFPKRGIFHVAVNVKNGAVVGFQNVEPFAAYTRVFDHVGIIGTFVNLSIRRQGVATALFEAMFRALALKGYEKLFAYVRADNPAALATYLKHGFKIIGTAHKHAKINGVYVDELLIEKLL